MQEANSSSPMTTRPIAQLLNQLQRFLSQKQFKDAERTWQSLLRSFNQFTVEQMQQFFDQTYLLHLHYLELKTLANAKLICCELEKTWLNNTLLHKELQANFQHSIGQAYLQTGYYDEAINHLCSALHLAQQPATKAALNADLTQLEILTLNQILERFLMEQLATVDINKLSFEGVLTWLTALQPLADRLASQMQWDKVNELYQGFSSLIQRYLSLVDSILNKKKQESVKAFHVATTELLAPLSLFISHRQYETALTVLQYIDQHAQNEALNYDTTEILNQMAQVNAYHLGESAPSDIKIYMPLWQRYRETLASMRMQVSLAVTQAKPVTEIQSQLTINLKQFVAKILQQCEEFLGQPPCVFNVIGIGSIARNCPGPYSDLDCAILIADKNLRHHPYFQTFIHLFKFQLDLLGENNPPGLHIDSGDLGHFTSKEKDLINTPQGLANHFDPATVDPGQPEPYSLHRHTLIYASAGGETLVEDYLKLLSEKFEFGKPIVHEVNSNNWPLYQRLGLQYLQEHKRQLDVEIEKSHGNQIDLKKRYLSPLLLWLSDIALYFGIYKFDTKDILQTLKDNHYLHTHFVEQLEKALSDLQCWRIQAQLKACYQHDIIGKNASGDADCFILSEKEYQRLQQIDQQVLQPAYQSIVIHSPFDTLPFHPALLVFKDLLFKQAKAPSLVTATEITSMLTNLALLMLAEKNETYYPLLPPAWRREFLTLLQAQLQKGIGTHWTEQQAKQFVNTLSHIPAANGYRESERLQETNFYHSVAKLFIPLTTFANDNPAELMVTLQFVDEQGIKQTYQLHPNVVAQLIDVQTGRLKPTTSKQDDQEDKSRHRVVGISFADQHLHYHGRVESSLSRRY